MTSLTIQSVGSAFAAACVVSLIFILALMWKSLRDYSRTGPKLRDEIVALYRNYAIVATLRLSAWAFIVALYWSVVGVIAYLYLVAIVNGAFHFLPALLCAALGLSGAVTVRALQTLLLNPAVLASSSHYRMSRLYGIWRRLSPGRLRYLELCLAASGAVLVTLGLFALALRDASQVAGVLAVATAIQLAVGISAARRAEPKTPAQAPGKPRSRPNILMIGSDTLRVDRLGIAGYPRALTPTIDALAARGTWFENCYVPCGRTAPSLISLLTGTWPHTHGVRDNFVADAETRLSVLPLPGILASAGYHTMAISDWCGADLGKFDLGFDECDLPSDSWNIRYFLKQGPKDLRLFLSLFLRNRIGKRMIPEVYYQGGVPTTDALGRDVRTALSRLGRSGEPFLLNAFFSTTHPPFGSEFPYYTLFSEPGYVGESKFAMARLTDPFEIIRRQGEPRREFDLDQILDLYDGCVKRFDDEIARILDHLHDSGLADNTIVVIYSDHGMEFFEHETWGQGNSVIGDHSARIPLIVMDPRRAGGYRIREIVRSVDVAPTLLSLLGIDAPTEMDGVSLANCLDGAKAPDLTAYVESGIWLTDLPGMPANHLRYPTLLNLLDTPDRKTGTLAIRPEYKNIVVKAKDRMIRHKQWKLTRHPLEHDVAYRLFDLARDPTCRHDVATMFPDVFEKLKIDMEAWVARDTLHRAGRCDSPPACGCRS